MAKQLLDKTRTYYDEYPFIEGGENRIGWWKDYLRDFLSDEELQDSLVVDVGSGVGEISRGLIDRGARMTCLDLSMQSLRRCRVVNPEADVFNGSALDLPFGDNVFDVAISIGVLHHTPDCRRGFHELARVTAPGGTIVVFLYNFWSIYNPIFQAFKPVKKLVPLKRVPVWMVRMLQPFAKTHQKEKLDDEQLRRLLGDKLWTPQSTFHSVRQVRRWGREEGLTFTGHKRYYLGYANVMRFVKDGELDRSQRRELSVRCLGCARDAMQRSASGYTCSACARTYALDDGIFTCLE